MLSQTEKGTQYVVWKNSYPNNIANLLKTYLKTISSSSGIFWGSWTSVNLFCLQVLEVNKKNGERQYLLSCVLAFKPHWTSSTLLLMHTLLYAHDITSPCGSLINCFNLFIQKWTEYFHTPSTVSSPRNKAWDKNFYVICWTADIRRKWGLGGLVWQSRTQREFSPL